MQVNQIYYAAFSAALMAGVEPGTAQQIAYQFTYLTHHSTTGGSGDDSPPDSCPGSWEPEEQEPPEALRVPINPLSHVDWLHGGKLNGRGLELSHHTYPGSHNTGSPQMKIINPAGQRRASGKDREREQIRQKLNRAILVAMMETDDTVQNKFVAALFSYIKQCASLDALSFMSTTYWMILHALRCYRFGSTFRWQPDYVANMKKYQQQTPMYHAVTKLQDGLHHQSDDWVLSNALCEQLNGFPADQRSQCLPMGIAFRHDLIDSHSLAFPVYAPVLHLSGLDDALGWLSEPC